MIVPDQSHINRIREALWQLPEGCASVMVGAGFSHNARKVGPHADEFPLWQDIATSICARLYPPGDGDRLKHAMTEASGTSGFLRLAQEYEAAFGRSSLHLLIKELVPDDDYVPDDMHIRLLRLPWRDIFTTNWDTLLERTRALVVDRVYNVVRTFDEIPSASMPRIIKLHGSFPAHIPFVLTEEDYRTYPKQYAPYVNMVQQAMMETVLLLIGFSGDDPNFLHWSGWVRDNLGKSAPKIYLAGWLNLSPHRRRMLEERGVVPIDIAHHPQAFKWPDHLRHRYATEWILYTLEHGRPYDISEWPSRPNWRRSTVHDILLPVEDVTVDAPVEEPRPPQGGTEPSDLLEQVRTVIKAWKHNRKIYPGWLIIPPIKHHLVGMLMHDWEQSILRIVPEVEPLERLSMIRELVWRLDSLLEPMSEKLEAAAQAILDNIDCLSRTICGIEDNSLQWSEIREVWRELAMALLTAARQRFDRDAFDHRIASLKPFQKDHPDVAQRIHHENCLWALYSLDFESLDKLLKEWHPEDYDPIWMSRKASILVEMDRNDEAVRLVNRSLSIIRAAPHHGRSLASPSREGWILWLALAFERNFLQSTDEVIDAPPAFSRWKQLALLQCDAFEQKQEVLRVLRGDQEKKDVPLFDLGLRRGKSISYSNIEYERWIEAHKAVRLCETAGLPPTASHMIVASDILALAANRLANTDQSLASRIALRIATSDDDETFDRVWSRSRIAIMPIGEVDIFINLVKNVISYALPRVNGASIRSTFWVTRLRVAMEALSRLVLRLPPERVEHMFKQALIYYRREEIARHPWLDKPMEHLLDRTWEALPKSSRAELILEILSAPIAGLDGFETSQQFYPDPGELLINDNITPLPLRTPETEGRWSEIVHLIIRGLGSAEETRKKTSLRLAVLSFWGLFSESETKLVAQALWKDSHTSQDSLPSGTSLLDWTFLFLPEPEPGLAEQRFRKKWFSPHEPRNERDFCAFFEQVGNALHSFRKRHHPLSLNDEERVRLASIVEKWILLPVGAKDPWGISIIANGVAGLQFILREIDLPPTTAEMLFEKAIELNKVSAPGFRLFNCLLKFLPSKFNDIVMSLRIGLVSDDVDQAENAILGLQDWLRHSTEEESPIPSTPDDLIQEIGVIIATRRKGVLIGALRVACWVFSKGSNEQREAIVHYILHGLRYLMEELSYERDQEKVGKDEVPLLRWGCVHLALAMMNSGYETDPTVKCWADLAQDDPLPEVRNAEVQAVDRVLGSSPKDN